jgi:hypothetical protein
MSVAEQLVPVGEWRADGVHSSVRCEVAHMTGSNPEAIYETVPSATG